MYKTNKIEVLDNGTIQLRQIEVLELADGTTRDGGFHRVVLTPDMDIETIECPRCKNIAKDEWTKKVIEDYKAIFEHPSIEE